MKLIIKAATTSKMVTVFVQDSSVSTGIGLGSLVYNTASLTGYYYREGAGASVAITLATMTLGTWATGGFVVVDGTNMLGLYSLGIPDAAIAAGAKSVVIYLKGATNMAPCVLEIQLVAYDPDNATTLGLTNLDAAITSRLASAAYSAPPTVGDIADAVLDEASNQHVSAGTVGIILTTLQADTDDIQSRLPAALVGGRMDSSTGAMAASVLTATAIATDAITAAKIATDAIGASELAADAITEIQSGLATTAALADVQADTDNIQTRIPTILVGGRMDASVGAMAANVVTAAAIAADAIGASELATDAVAEIQTGLSTFNPATDTVARVTLVDTATALTGKTGFGLAATGLDSIAITAPSTVATTFPGMVVQLWRRFYKKSTLTSTQLKTLADDGSTVITTQTVSDDGTVQTQGTAS